MDEENRVELGYCLNRAFTALVRKMDSALSDSGLELNHAQFSVIQALRRNENGIMSQREISEALGKDPAAISRAIGYLEAHGYVQRKPVSGCKNGVSLTQKTKECFPEIERAIKETIETACSGISERDYAITISVLKAIHSNLK